MPEYVAGTDGRVKEGTTTPTAIAGLTKWGFDQTAPVFDATNFESATDADGNVHQELVIGGNTANSAAAGAKVGIVKNVVNLEGRLDANTLTGTYNRLYVGKRVILDLLVNKTSAKGLYGLQGVVSECKTGVDIKSTDAAAFNAKVELSGVPAGLATARV